MLPAPIPRMMKQAVCSSTDQDGRDLMTNTRKLKSYTVTLEDRRLKRISPYALDEVKGLDNALTHALNLIQAGHQDVAIQDGTRKSVSGDLLMACCRGEKELTPDLFS
jgi:hypothetical protein